MPSASDNKIGFGRTGLLGNLRTHGDFQRDNRARRQGYVDLVLGKAITKTGTYLGSIRYTDLSVDSALTWAGAIRPIVGMEAMRTPRALSFAESLASMAAGTFFYDETQMVKGGTLTVYWWLPDSSNPSTSEEFVIHLMFNIGTRGERHPLFLPERFVDGGFAYWTSPTVPKFWTPSGVAASGVRLDQDTDAAPSSKDPYSLKISPGASGLPNASDGGVLIDGATSPPGFNNGNLGAGRETWYTFYYKTDPDMPVGVFPAIRVRAGSGQFMNADGESFSVPPNNVPLPLTNGQWRRCIFVFRNPSDTTSLSIHLRLRNDSGGTVTTGWVKYDGASLRTVLRRVYYQPGLEIDSLPVLELKSQSVAFGAKTIGQGKVSILDGNRALTKAFASLLPLRKPVKISVGGAFSNKEFLRRDDWRTAFLGLSQTPLFKTQEGRIVIDLEDSRTITRSRVLEKAYRIADLSGLDREAEGTPKNYVFGDTIEQAFKYTRVGVNSNGYGLYEALDPAVPVADNVNVGLPTGYSAIIFPNEEMADKNVNGYDLSNTITGNTAANPTAVTTSKRHGLATNDFVTISGSNSTPNINGRRQVTVTSDFTFTVAVNVSVAGTTGKVVSHADYDYSLNNTRWEIKRDLHNMAFDKQGQEIGLGCRFYYMNETYLNPTFVDLDLSGPPWKVALDLQAAIRANDADNNTSVVYAENTHKITVSRTGGKGVFIDLYSVSSVALPNIDSVSMRSWELLGYDVRGDHGGGATTSWTAEKPLFTDVDKDHIIRWFVGGYYDDSLGSICGVANAAIDNPPAIYSWLWQKHLRQSPSTINVNSFADARNLSFSGDFVQMLMVLLNQDDDVFKAFGLLDQMGLMDTVLDGDGVLQCRKHSDSAPVVRVLRDRDYQSFEMRYDPKILFREVRVWGSYRQSLQKFETYLDSPAFTDAAAPIKTGATDIFNLYGYLSRASITGGLCLLPNYYARLFKKVPRIVQLSTVGQLIDTFIGDKISLYASKALSPTGTLSGEVFRIFNLTHDYLTGMTTCEAVENVQILT